ncbi:hypothetical protein FB446DRAFT_646265 [Lentinula raphanica]|nr:hypothetical protein FB446DRAFT_646265 [Lentinula raphanica]
MTNAMPNLSTVVDIEEEENTPFNADAWIGKGKKFTPNCPLNVVNAHRALLALPQCALEHLPSLELPIVDFVQLNLPIQSQYFDTHPIESWFRVEVASLPDDAALELVIQRPIPPKDVLDSLQALCGQKWLDGAKSIVDPRFRFVVDSLPLWVLTFWRQLSKLRNMQEDWDEVIKTLTRLTRDPSFSQKYPSPESILGRRSWNGDVGVGGFVFDTHTFSGLLSPKMLNVDIAQSMTQVLQSRLEQDSELSKAHYIAASRFSLVLQNTRKRTKYTELDLPKSLRLIEEHVTINPSVCVWFPVLLQSMQHEVAFCVDFGKRTVEYDSHELTPPPTKTIADIQHWLRIRFGGPFTSLGNTLAHGTQKDGISCIPAAMNTIAHGVFGDELWHHDHRWLNRIAWFHTFVHDRSGRTRQPGTRISLNDLLNPAEESACLDIIEDVCEEITGSYEDNSANDSAIPLENDFSEYEMIPTSPVPAPSELSPAPSQAVSNPDRSSGSQTHAPESAKRADVGFWKSLLTGKGPSKRAAPSNMGAQKASKKAKVSKDEERVGGPSGISKAAISQRKSREDADAGRVDAVTRERWKRKILILDKNAEFDENKLRAVRCSRCSSWVLVKDKNDVSRFRDHQQKCLEKKYDKKKKNAATAHTSTLLSDVMRAKWDLLAGFTRRLLPMGKSKPRPCPRLTDAQNPQITSCLRRSAASGGGASSASRTALKLFNKPYRKLTSAQKDEVSLQQLQDFRWRNDHLHLCIFSTSCSKYARETSIAADGTVTVIPCPECLSLLSLKEFKNLLRKPIPTDANYKYMNRAFYNKVVGKIFGKKLGLQELIETSQNDKQSVFLKFAQGAVEGKYKDDEVFLGLVHAMVNKIDRKDRGVGMQNFTYTPAWDEFAHIVSIHSPRAYDFLQRHFPARDRRSFRSMQSRKPKLPLTICDETFSLVKSRLDALGYSGPVAVACDDTKLFSSLRLYWDSTEGQNGSYVLVGGTKGPIVVENPDDVERYMKDPSITKGTKVRLWIAIIPFPKMSPIVVAAQAISDDLGVSALHALHNQVIMGLLDHGVDVASYSCDGTETERKVQREFLKSAESHISVDIPSPREGFNPISIQIPIYRGRPIALIQDSKHALKTFRNNLFSGARLLVLGNRVALYHQIREIAFDPTSPLYHRDVEKLDRQDDNAAARLFSAATLQFISQRLNEEDQELLGVAVYLFIFGELCDAYQNRHIPHAERIALLLRARYFVDTWKQFIDKLPCYNPNKYFLSHECVDIIRFLVISDFTMLDFLHMQPKLEVQLREAVLNSHLTETTGNMKARAAGYHHTYASLRHIDIMALGEYPSYSEIERISQTAAGESESLWACLGVYPEGDSGRLSSDLPDKEPLNDELDDIFDFGEEFDMELEELEYLIHLNEGRSEKLTVEQQNRLQELTDASLSVIVDDQIDDETYEEFLAQDRRALAELNSMVNDIPQHFNVASSSQNMTSDSMVTISDGVSIANLVVLREKHQTFHAAHAVRTHGKDKAREHCKEQEADSSAKAIRKAIVQTFHAELKQLQDQGLTTGDDRSKRWTGNASNAAVVAKSNAEAALAKRRRIFLARGIPHFDGYIDMARISAVHRLQLKEYGLIWTEHGIFLGKVIAMYSKGGGKHGKHAAVTAAENISALSYLGVQLFQHAYQGRFKPIPTLTSSLQIHAFAFIESYAFLTRISNVQQETTGMLRLANAIDLRIFNDLNGEQGRLGEAMKDFRKRSK